VFRMNTDGTGFSLLHRFAGWPSDAAHPTGDLTLDGDTLCGMALSGGARNNWRGAVFRIRTDGTGYSIVHNFAGQVHNGAGPHGSLLLQDGRLFGLASGGGQDNAGALFSLDFHPPAGPDIQANSADGVVRLAAGERVIVTVSMRPGALEGYLADWWVAARAGADWYALDPRLNWVPVSAWDQIRPVYQGALVSLWPTVILNSASLPHGDYVVYMAVDPLDGRLNPEGPIWSDAVSLAIR